MLKKLIASSLAVTLVVTALSFAAADENKSIESFVAHIDKLDSLSAEKKSAIKTKVEKLAADPYSMSDAITEGLCEIYPEYKKAVSADESASIKLLQPLVDSSDKFLAADAMFYMSRALLNEEKFETALPILKKLSKMGEYTVHADNSLYFMGVAQTNLLKNKEAINSFSKFLKDADNAPERLRVAAWRQIETLRTIKAGQLKDIHQRMVFSENRLKKEKSGEVTQEQQRKIVKMLSKLIKEQEKKECSNCKSNCKNSQQKEGQAKSQGQQGNQQSAGKSSKGGTSNNPNGSVQKRSFNGEASPWSVIRDRTRDAANTAVKDKLPAKYRDLIEKVNAKASGNSDK